MEFSEIPDADGDSGGYGRRRVLQLLQGVGVAGLVGAAGCSGDDDGTDDETPTESATPTPTPGPASFTIDSVTPSEVSVPRGGSASVSVTVSNTGGSSGSETAALTMAGEEQDTKSISLGPGEETTVSLAPVTDIAPDEYGFTVEVGDESTTGTLTTIENPNVVVLFTEDWNWGTVWEDEALETPAIDQIASNGVSFDRAFCSSPSCSPSRSAILSGQHFYRTGESAVLWGGYPDDLASYPELLSESDYAVGHTGKGYGPGPNEDKAGSQVESLSALIEDSGEDPFCFWEGTSAAHRDFPTATEI
jgi:hypothetical protein